MRRQNRVGICWNAFVVFIFLLLILFPWSRFFASGISLGSMLAGPGWQHLLGTDNLGRDLLVRSAGAIWGAVLPLWSVVLVGTVTGLAGAATMIAWSESRVQRRAALTILRGFGVFTASVPAGIVAFAWAAYDQQAGLLPVAATLGLVFCIRAFLQLCDQYAQSEHLGYWQAQKSMGGGLMLRIWRYGILGDWAESLLASVVFHLRVAVTIEASLSYLGFGIQEPDPSLGNMLASHFDLYLKGQWYTMAVLCVVLLLVAQFPTSLLRLVSHSWRTRVSP